MAIYWTVRGAARSVNFMLPLAGSRGITRGYCCIFTIYYRRFMVEELTLPLRPVQSPVKTGSAVSEISRNTRTHRAADRQTDKN